MAPSPGRRGQARRASDGARSARSLRAIAAEAERERSSPRELARLLSRAAVGDAAAADRVFNENLAMVLRHARGQAVACEGALTEDELLQEGSMALMSAIRDFGRDQSGGGEAAGFTDYAERQVVETMAHAVESQQAAERDQLQLVADAEAYERAEVSIRRDKRRDPTNAELAEKLEWSQDKTRLLGEMVAEARRLHDEELLHYVEPDELSELDDE